ncbi:MAG TPA: AtpZ/AtpI family protein [Gemmataceae bacterium]|nr:AtpZ/AtpI family protein [Gemmataceae bacterium]
MADRQEDRRRLGLYFSLAQCGGEMVVPLVAGLLLDRSLHTMPWLTITGAVVGFVVGLVHMVVILNRLDQKPSGPADREEP